MRKIERDIACAIRNGKRLSSRNTRVIQLVGGGFQVSLHDNVVAHAAGRKPDGSVWGVTLDHCGWKTTTTKSRINAVLAGLGSTLRVYCRKGDFFVWDSSRPNEKTDHAFGRTYSIEHPWEGI